MFVDTIGALLPLEGEVVAGEFDGEVRNVDLRTGVEQRRLFHNPRGEYAPRVTYWPGSAIKVEFSAQKMSASVDQALDAVDGFVRAKYGALPGVRAWKCQRVDYAYNFEVGDELPLYLAVVQELRLRSWARVPFAGSGVVWKGAGSRGRWVKFYTKHATEGGRGGAAPASFAGRSGHPALRYEVSNYRDAVEYMAKHWFGCARTVGEMVQPGRALYVLEYFLDKLGLNVRVGEQESEHARLRAEYGERGMASALRVLTLHREYGTASYKTLGLVSKQTYCKWMRSLRDKGFIGESCIALRALSIAFEGVLGEKEAKILKVPEGGSATSLSKNGGRKNWDGVKKSLGIFGAAPVVASLLERAEDGRNIHA